MAPVSMFFEPQNCGAVAQMLRAKGRLQGDSRLFGNLTGSGCRATGQPPTRSALVTQIDATVRDRPGMVSA